MYFRALGCMFGVVRSHDYPGLHGSGYETTAILLTEEILHHLKSLKNWELQSLWAPRRCKILSINSRSISLSLLSNRCLSLTSKPKVFSTCEHIECYLWTAMGNISWVYYSTLWVQYSILWVCYSILCPDSK